MQLPLLKDDVGFPTKPLVITYDVPDGFCANQKVVLNKITFRTGHGNAGVGKPWGDYATRRAKTVTIEASNDGLGWVTLVEKGTMPASPTVVTIPDAPEDANFDYSDNTLSFENTRSYRHYRITVSESYQGGNYKVIFNELMLEGEYGEDVVSETVEGDITAAVRDEGYQPTYKATVNGVDATIENDVCNSAGTGYETLFNGTWGYFEGSAWKYQQDSFLLKSVALETKPLVITYDVPSGFHAGEDVVVRGISFRMCAGPAGFGQQWGDYEKRRPTKATIEGSNDGTNWTIVRQIGVNDFKYSETVWTDETFPDRVGKFWYSDTRADFPNYTSYRHYRISVKHTAAYNDSIPLIVSEVQLLGAYGGEVTRPTTPQPLDITAEVRGQGLSPTLSMTQNGKPVMNDGGATQEDPGQFFNGSWGEYGYSSDGWTSDRGLTYMAPNDGMPKNGNPLVFQYDLPAAFYPGEAIVVTGVTFRLGSSNASGGKWGDNETRLPSDFALEGKNDGDAEWTVIRRVLNGQMTLKEYLRTDASRPDEVGLLWYHDKGAVFAKNWKSYRHYRIVVYSTNKDADLFFQVGEILLSGLCGGEEVPPEPGAGDITAEVRSFGFSTEITSSHESLYDGAESLVDGWLSAYADFLAGYTKSQRYFIETDSVTPANPVVLTMTIPNDFYEGEDVVVTGLSFVVGGSYEGDREHRTIWGNDKDRLPTSWTLEGSNDGGTTWFTICDLESDEFKSTNYQTVYHKSSVDQKDYNDYVFAEYSGFVNFKPARKYRLTLTGSDVTNGKVVNTFAYQICEIKLFGSYGGTCVPPPFEGERMDITAAFREVGKQTVGWNMTANSGLDIPAVFDGNHTSANRALATADSTAAAFAAGGAKVEWGVAGNYLYGADIVATGYRLSTASNHGNSLARMPTTWEFQGSNDGETWVTIDAYTNFTMWARGEVEGVDSYYFDFRFPNTQSFRKYRFNIHALNGGDAIQFTEIEIFGYVGPNATQNIPEEDCSYPLDLTRWGSSKTFLGALGYFTPIITPEQSDKWALACSGLFTWDERDRGLAQDISMPLAFTYEIPADFLAGEDFIITNYEFMVRTVNDKDNRRPKTWRLEGWDEAQQRWVKVDARMDFDDWQVGSSLGYNETEPSETKYAVFDAVNPHGYAFRKYRFLIQAVRGVNATMGIEFQLGQIFLRGKWGKGIGAPVPERSGLTIWFY